MALSLDYYRNLCFSPDYYSVIYWWSFYRTVVETQQIFLAYQMDLEKSIKIIFLPKNTVILHCKKISRLDETEEKIQHQCRWRLYTEVMLCWGKRANDAMLLFLHLYILKSSQLMQFLMEKWLLYEWEITYF